MALIKCEECGHMVSDRAEACPKCGCPIDKTSGPVTTNTALLAPATRKGKLEIWFWGLLILFGILLVLTIVGVALSYSTNDRDKEVDRQELANRFISVESITKNIEGTIWTYTQVLNNVEDGEYWYRLHFTNGLLYMQETRPMDGEWGEPKTLEYEVGEHRYSNTGGLYVSVNWEKGGDHYIFQPETGDLRINMIHYSMQGWDLSTWHYVGSSHISISLHEGDINPWEE